MSQKHHVFIIGSVWIEPNSSAAGTRMLQLVEFFQSQKWKVNFGTTASKTENSIDLTNLQIDEYLLQLNDTSFDELLKEIDPTVVLFDRYTTEEQFGWRVAEACPDAIRILDTEDLHCLRKARQEAVKKGISFTHEQVLDSEVAKREIAAIYRSDMSLMISDFEMELLTNTFQVDTSILFYLPFLLDQITQEEQNQWKAFEERNHFVSIGNFLHPPNMDATVQLKKNIWKRIRERLPQAELHIYGAYPNQQALNFTNKREGFFVHGYVEDAQKVIGDASVMLAPLRFGAGLKGKLVEAMRNGTPSVTTAIGAEGIADGHSWNGFITDDFDEFVEKAIDLYSNKDVWLDAQLKGETIIKDRFDKTSFEAKLLRRIEELSTRLKQHRIQNFHGAMLLHHTLKSTKYMSKWIEEKNKKS